MVLSRRLAFKSHWSQDGISISKRDSPAAAEGRRWSWLDGLNKQLEDAALLCLEARLQLPTINIRVSCVLLDVQTDLRIQTSVNNVGHY